MVCLLIAGPSCTCHDVMSSEKDFNPREKTHTPMEKQAACMNRCPREYGSDGAAYHTSSSRADNGNGHDQLPVVPYHTVTSNKQDQHTTHTPGEDFRALILQNHCCRWVGAQETKTVALEICREYLRRTIVSRTYGINKNLYIYPNLQTILGPINYGPP